MLARVALVLLCHVALLASCSRSPDDPGTGGDDATPSTPTTTPTASTPLNEGSGAPIETTQQSAHYEIATPAVTLASGAPGQLTLTVTPRAGFKINLLFPWRLTFSEGAGVTPERLEWSPQDARLTEEAATFTVPVTSTTTGSHSVSANLRFSVCNDLRCETPTADVAWTVQVQ